MSVVKTFGLVLGYNEFGLRLFPFLCSLAAIFLLYRLGQKFIESAWVLALIVLLFGLSNWSILEANSIKQYVCDLVITLGLCLYTLKDDYRRFYDRNEVIKWTVVGAILVWSSMPVVFTMAAIGAYYAWQAFQDKAFFQWLKPFAIPVTIWIINFAIYFVTILHTDAKSDYLQNYHQIYFLKAQFWTGEGLRWNVDLIYRIFAEYIGNNKASFYLVFSLYGLGLVQLFRKDIKVLFLFFIPFAICLLSSMLGYYSLIERLLLFTMPVQFIIMGIGLERIYQSKDRLFSLVHIALVGIITYGISGWVFFFNPDIKAVLESTRNSLEYIHKNRQPSEAILVNHLGTSVAKFYTSYHSKHKEKFSNCLPYHVADQEVKKLQDNPTIEVLHQETVWRSRAVKVRRIK